MAKGKIIFRRIRGRIIPIIKKFAREERRGPLFSRPAVQQVRAMKQIEREMIMTMGRSTTQSMFSKSVVGQTLMLDKKARIGMVQLSPRKREIYQKAMMMSDVDLAARYKGALATGTIPKNFKRSVLTAFFPSRRKQAVRLNFIRKHVPK